jgi:hypothetical protein
LARRRFTVYVDGNTGSMIAQVLVAGTAGVAVAGTAAWRKMTGPVRRAKKDSAQVEPNPLDAKTEQQ